MSRRTDAVTITVDFSKDTESDDWIGTSLSTPRISVQKIDIRRARSTLAAKLRAELGKPVRIVDQISLRPELDAEITRFRQLRETLREAERSAAKRFIPLAKALLRARLEYQQVAELLRVSPQVLSQRLRRHYAGPHRERTDA